ncbi:RNA-directed DNA polymerase, eukaryota [Tanacetum coccineum]
MPMQLDVLKSSNTNPNSLTVSSPTIVLVDFCIVERDFSSSLTREIKDINAMSNLYIILANEGFENVKLSYLGEIWVLMEMDSIVSKEKISKHVGVRSWFSELKPACNSFVSNKRIVWIFVEGLPIKAYTRNTFAKIVSQWGELTDVEDKENSILSFKRLCLKSKPYLIINDKIKIIIKGQIDWIWVKDLEAWCPDFDVEQEDSNSSDEESKGDFVGNKIGNFDFDNEDDIDHVSDSSCMHGKDKPSNSNEPVDPNKSEDPFEIYKILKKKKESEVTKSDDPQFPPGFTPEVVDENVIEINPDDVVEDNVKEIGSEKNLKSKNSVVNNKEGFSSEHIGSSFASKFKTGGSILEVMDELITMGQTMGCNMEGCMKNIESIIGLGNKAKKGWIQELNLKHRVNFVAIQETKMQKIDLFSIKALWGNFCFDYALCSSIGFSGGILCVWDPRLFVKDNVTVSDSFLAVSGTWVPSSTKLLIISVYAPQELSDRKMLWDYFHHLIDSWDGECVILGDFNEVRSEHERHGTVFNLNGTNAFNNFITMAGLVDLPLEGYSFTWSHKSASKMSKLDRFLITEGLLSLFPSMSVICLDRHLSDHRPILLRELNVDYGPSPFCFFHSWSHKKGFDKFVETTWKNAACMETNAIVNLKKKLQALKTSIKQ